ncbi:dihydrofolate reductase [Aeromonas caviae]|uniref:dihydrofolate reductase n=1 Tax=Aeromonas caviae TaxID=648 RepID=UPI00191D9A95|nr:dihydrofolate reductase [Aeromonas caviae]MBL0499474.1 dihydrofolate reductase [Aeromonas caviae]
MRISLIAAIADNDVIGKGNEMPWQAKGEQLLFKALTYNQMCIVGRKTYAGISALPNRRFAVISRTLSKELGSGAKINDNATVYESIEAALDELVKTELDVFAIGGAEIYRQILPKAHILHVSHIHEYPEGDVVLPELSPSVNESIYVPCQNKEKNRSHRFRPVFVQTFESNINYTYKIYERVD